LEIIVDELTKPKSIGDPETDEEKHESVLVVGGIGTGKTTQLCTLPGKKFLYVFDPNCIPSLRKRCKDLEYLEFFPDKGDLDLGIKPLAKDLKRDASSKKKAIPEAYIRWEEDYERRKAEGFFKGYSWLGFDSFTTFSDIVMDRVQYLAGRLGKHPEQADWTAQMNTLKNIFRDASSIGINLFCTAHTELDKDGTSGKIYGQIIMTGKLRVRIPLLFSNILATRVDSDNEKSTYQLITRPDRENPVVRTSLIGLDQYEDVTIDWKRDPIGQGLGALLVKQGRI
jgi:hypothetical protein